MRQSFYLFLLLITLTACTQRRVVERPLSYAEKMRLIRHSDGTEVFSTRDISKLHQAGVTYAYACEMTAIKSNNGTMLLETPDITWLKNLQAKPAFIKRIAAVNIWRDKDAFSGSEIARLYATRTNAAVIAYLGLLYTNKAKPVFSAKDLILYLDYGGREAYADSLLQSFDNDYNTLLSGFEISQLKVAGISARLAVDCAQLNRTRQVFSAHELLRYLQADGSVSYAQHLADAGFSGASIYRFRQLGLSRGEVLQFTDTDKPNAVCIYAEYDDNDEFERPSAIRLFNEIHKRYDVWVRIIGSRDLLLVALEQAPDADLLM
ncbi:MAG: hypothetical protein K8S56_00685, partial [Candidatus Cloacimonetes bacterium]|nr:hypothetical protein [Candidatus Cloacimonadota bacterium]